MALSNQHRHFTLVVVGDNHAEMVKKYNKNLKVKKHLVYKFEDAEKLYQKKLFILNSLINEVKDNDERKEFLTDEYNYYKELDYLEYYTELTEGLIIDDETGDAYTDKNPDGKYDTARVAGVYALPLIDKNGNETYSCKKGDVDWSRIHLFNTYPYEVAWDTVMGGKEPENDAEKYIYENMKNRTTYFEYYVTKENYVKSSTSFWGYAFLSEETGWLELEDNMSQIEWVSNFYDKFIVPLKEEDIITIYECTREEN
jgi:hypothetical protein